MVMTDKKPSMTNGAAGLFLLIVSVALVFMSLPTLSSTVYPVWLPVGAIRLGLGLTGLILFGFSLVCFMRAITRK